MSNLPAVAGNQGQALQRRDPAWMAYAPEIKAMFGSAGLKDAEFEAFLMTAAALGLDPRKGLIKPIRFGNVLQSYVTIDGWRTRAEETGKYRPGEIAFEYTPDRKLRAASCTVYKLWVYPDKTHEWFPVTETVLWDNFGKGKSNNWINMPEVMLSNCAERRAIRRAFPNRFTGDTWNPDIEVTADNEVVDLGVATDETAPPLPKEEPVTEAQRGKFFALLKELGIDDKNESEAATVKATMKDLTGKDSIKEMTKAEFSLVIDHYQHALDHLTGTDQVPPPAESAEQGGLL